MTITAAVFKLDFLFLLLLLFLSPHLTLRGPKARIVTLRSLFLAATTVR